MLEIVLLHRLCKAVGRLSRSKGLPVAWFQASLITAWFGGEVYGGVASAMMAAIAAPSGHHEAPLGLMYASAILCAACGAGVIFGLVWILPAERRHLATQPCGHCGEAVAGQNLTCPMCGQPLLVNLRRAA